MYLDITLIKQYSLQCFYFKRKSPRGLNLLGRLGVFFTVSHAQSSELGSVHNVFTDLSSLSNKPLVARFL